MSGIAGILLAAIVTNGVSPTQMSLTVVKVATAAERVNKSRRFMVKSSSMRRR